METRGKFLQTKHKVFDLEQNQFLECQVLRVSDQQSFASQIANQLVTIWDPGLAFAILGICTLIIITIPIPM